MPTTEDLLYQKAYRTWMHMRARCNNPNASGYKYYGGRGIQVCDWWDNFANFLHDVGLPPSLKHSIDRINNDGDYYPGNVRWATTAEQAANKRLPYEDEQDTQRRAWRMRTQ